MILSLNKNLFIKITDFYIILHTFLFDFMCDIPKTIKKCIKICLVIIKQFKENGGIPSKPVLSFLPVSVK